MTVCSCTLPFTNPGACLTCSSRPRQFTSTYFTVGKCNCGEPHFENFWMCPVHGVQNRSATADRTKSLTDKSPAEPGPPPAVSNEYVRGFYDGVQTMQKLFGGSKCP